MKLIVDKHGDVYNGYHVRIADGSLTGDLEKPIIATFYDLSFAEDYVFLYNWQNNPESVDMC